MLKKINIVNLRLFILKFIYTKKVLLKISRATSMLKKNKNKRYLIENIKEEIVNKKLKINNNSFLNLNFFFGDLEIPTRQYLAQNYLTFNFHSALLYSYSTNFFFFYPAPLEWLNIIQKNGIKVSKLFSYFLFILYTILFFVLGYVKTLLDIVIQFQNLLLRNNFQIKSNDFFFLYLKKSNILGFRLGKKFGVMSSIYNINLNEIKNRKLINFYHNAKKINNFKNENINVKFTNDKTPGIYSFLDLLIIFIWVNLFFTYCLILSIFGRWQLPLMFHEIYNAKKTQIAKKKYLYKKYFCPHAPFPYKPLWLAIIEERKIDVIQYFYSISNESYETDEKIYKFKQYFNLLNFKHYYAWNSDHANFLKKMSLIKNPKIEITSPISYKTHDEEFELNNDSIIIFDVEPHKYIESMKYRAPFYGDIMNILWSDATIQFLDDIIQVNKTSKYSLYLKRKRSLTSDYNYLKDKKYTAYLSRINKLQNFNELNPSFDPSQIFDKNKKIKLVICLPFTSVAFVAKYLNIPVIFYDPFGKLDMSLFPLGNIPLIKGRKNLNNFIKLL